ncbi:MAG: c-type cytochrome [Ignavibacteriae bacterium]|nr:c-type cytochrome [Ignavibacteriota bacterium]MCB9215760.1 c-type cytochrome [Ignavibacteria bacterium]
MKTLGSILFLFLIGMPTAILLGQDVREGEALFKTCATCHSIGAGKLIGPDLANIDQRRTEPWLIKFIHSSQSMVKGGDKDAVAIFNEYKIPMPDQNLSDQQIRSILAYIVSKSPGREVPNSEPEVVADKKDAVDSLSDTLKPEPLPPGTIAGRTIEDATKFDFITGGGLFSGRLRFDNGGPSCISCHTVRTDEVISGGALAKDLTDSYGRLSAAGLAAFLGSPQFPAMATAYQDHPLTEEEIYGLVAFLKEVNDNPSQSGGNYGVELLLGGGIGAVLLLGMYAGLWFRRRKGTVHQEIFSRQMKSE